MLKITVQRDGTGDFTTISEAVLAVPPLKPKRMRK